MPHASPTPTTVLGLGAMGQALARTLLAEGHPTTVWNRSPGRAEDLVAAGAEAASDPGAAASASPLVIVCLLDHASVHHALDPFAAALAGRTLVNLTSTTPDESRELASWAANHGATYLDGGIMAIPEMIGQPEASLLYSGAESAFEQHRATLAQLGTPTYLGDDAGHAALYDFALLAAMYAMFGGFFHAVAMVGTAGVSAREFAPTVVAWLQAMAETLPEEAELIDGGDYRTDVQSLDFNISALDKIVQASVDAEVDPTLLLPLQQLVRNQIGSGHGAAAFPRVIESLRLSRTI